MPAKTNTAPTALGGTKPSPDEPALNRAMKDPAMAAIPRLSPQPAAAVMPGLDPGIDALRSRHSRGRACEDIEDWLDQRRASFETAAEPVLGPAEGRTRGRLPQDEEFFLMPSMTSLILRSAQRARLEGRTTALPAEPPEDFSAMPHTPRHSRAGRIPRARPAWGNPQPAPLLSPGAGSGLNRGPAQAPEILSAMTPPVSAFPAIPGTAHQGRPSADGTHFAAAPAPKETPMTLPRAIPPREILFLDPVVSDIATLLGHLRPEIEAILLDPVRPAAHQMATALAGERDLAAIHIIAHGAPGHVNFTAGDWSAETVADDAADLAVIGQALAASGDLRLWSCRTAAGPAGAAFVAGLARASGADTAAASGRVGAAALGGGWELGAAAQPPLTSAGVGAYAGVLPAIEITVSGRIPDASTSGAGTGSTTYFVVDKDKNAIVGNITLPNTPFPHSAFRIVVRVPSGSKSFDVGVFDDTGGFVSAGFTVEVPEPPSGAVGPRG